MIALVGRIAGGVSEPLVSGGVLRRRWCRGNAPPPPGGRKSIPEGKRRAVKEIPSISTGNPCESPKCPFFDKAARLNQGLLIGQFELVD